MGLMEFLGMGKAAGEVVASTAEPIKAVGNVFDQLFTSDEERLSKKEAMERLAQKPHIAQTEINKLEAQHRSWFVAGWRPSIGWVCSASLACFFIPQYATASYLWAKMCLEGEQLLPYPTTADGLFQLVLALLGMGGIRMVEKLAGKAK